MGRFAAMLGYTTSSAMRHRLQAHEPARRLTLRGHAVTLLPAAAYDIRYVPPAAVIGFAFETQSGTHAFASDRPRPFRTRPNSTAYIPAGCEVASRSATGGEYLTISIADGEHHLRLPAQRFNDRIDRQAIAAAQDLRRMLLTDAAIDALDAERAISVLVDSVLREDIAIDAATAARSMTVQRLRFVDELIGDGLSGELLVGDIAGRLGLSPGFFNRAFKAAIGKTPHDYILDRRVSRARRLIASTDLPLVGIAAACGFASQPHMTTQFQQRIGMTPGALRARAIRAFSDEVDTGSPSENATK